MLKVYSYCNEVMCNFVRSRLIAIDREVKLELLTSDVTKLCTRHKLSCNAVNIITNFLEWNMFYRNVIKLPLGFTVCLLLRSQSW